VTVCKILRANSAAGLAHYLLDGDAHDGTDAGRYVFASGVGCIASTAAQEFAQTRTRYARQKVRVQAYQIIQSFGADELDADDPDACEKAHAIGLDLLAKCFPGHAGFVVTQVDGVGHCLHNHLVVNAIADHDAEFSWTDADGTHHDSHVRAGSLVSSAMRNYWAIQRENDALVSTALGHDNAAYVASHARKKTAPPPGYDWAADLASIITTEASQASSVDDFRDRLAARRVELRQRGRGGVFSYGYLDATGSFRQSRTGGRSALGDECGRANVERLIATHVVTSVPEPSSHREQAARAAGGAVASPTLDDLLAAAHARMWAGVVEPAADAGYPDWTALWAAHPTPTLPEPEPPDPPTPPSPPTPPPLAPAPPDPPTPFPAPTLPSADPRVDDGSALIAALRAVAPPPPPPEPEEPEGPERDDGPEFY